MVRVWSVVAYTKPQSADHTSLGSMVRVSTFHKDHKSENGQNVTHPKAFSRTIKHYRLHTPSHHEIDCTMHLTMRPDIQWSLTFPDTFVPKLTFCITEFPDK